MATIRAESRGRTFIIGKIFAYIYHTYVNTCFLNQNLEPVQVKSQTFPLSTMVNLVAGHGRGGGHHTDPPPGGEDTRTRIRRSVQNVLDSPIYRTRSKMT